MIVFKNVGADVVEFIGHPWLNGRQAAMILGVSHVRVSQASSFRDVLPVASPPCAWDYRRMAYFLPKPRPVTRDQVDREVFQGFLMTIVGVYGLIFNYDDGWIWFALSAICAVYFGTMLLDALWRRLKIFIADRRSRQFD